MPTRHFAFHQLRCAIQARNRIISCYGSVSYFHCNHVVSIFVYKSRSHCPAVRPELDTSSQPYEHWRLLEHCTSGQSQGSPGASSSPYAPHLRSVVGSVGAHALYDRLSAAGGTASTADCLRRSRVAQPLERGGRNGLNSRLPAALAVLDDQHRFYAVSGSTAPLVSDRPVGSPHQDYTIHILAPSSQVHSGKKHR